MAPAEKTLATLSPEQRTEAERVTTACVQRPRSETEVPPAGYRTASASVGVSMQVSIDSIAASLNRSVPKINSTFTHRPEEPDQEPIRRPELLSIDEASNFLKACSVFTSCECSWPLPEVASHLGYWCVDRRGCFLAGAVRRIRNGKD
jgi:hypothetical protein